MKKRIITLSVVSLLTLAATGCSSKAVTKKVNNDKEDVIVTLKNSEGEINYTANDVFNDYLSTTAGASAAFSAVYDVLVNAGVELTQEMSNSVSGLVADLQSKAKQTAIANGTSYKEEESKALENANAESLDEYRQMMELNLKKEKFQNKFYDNQMYDGKMDSETPVVDEDHYGLSKEFIEGENPYHVRHILVKTSSTGSSFLPEAQTLTEDEAIKLGNTIKNLASESSTFGQVALDFSEDGSSSSFGSLNELMGRTTGYVNEFKFGVFQYDAYLNNNVNNGATSLDIPEYVDGIDQKTEDVLKQSMKLIPYAAAQALIDNAKITKDINNEQYKDGKEIYYPRNFIFDNYFNNHGLNFIFKGKDSTTSKNFKENAKVNELFATYFETNGYTGDERNILCDEKGNPILVTRAGTGSGDSGYQGIHFIVIENSPLVNENKLEEQNYTYSVEEELKYYSVNVPKNSDDVTLDKRYVTFIDSEQQTEYSDRAKEIKEAVQSYDSNMNFRLYEKILKQLEIDGKYQVTINEKINDVINEYIESTRNRTNRNKEQTYNDSWKTYVRQLVTQNEFSSYKVKEDTITKNFPVTESFTNIK